MNNKNMKATELRIGNLFLTASDEPELFIIDLIDSIEETVNGNGLEEIPINDLVKIPLTEYWLLRFGFEKCEVDDDYWYEYHSRPLRLVSNDTLFNKKENKWVIGFDYHDNETEFMDNRIKYVHQLQNLYFALTGEELEINKTNDKRTKNSSKILQGK